MGSRTRSDGTWFWDQFQPRRSDRFSGKEDQRIIWPKVCDLWPWIRPNASDHIRRYCYLIRDTNQSFIIIWRVKAPRDPILCAKVAKLFSNDRIADHVGTFSFDRQSLSRYRVGCSFAFADRGAKGKWVSLSADQWQEWWLFPRVRKILSRPKQSEKRTICSSTLC